MNEFELHRHLRRVRALPGTVARPAESARRPSMRGDCQPPPVAEEPAEDG